MITVTKRTRVLALTGALLAFWHGSAAAQAEDDRVFLNLSLGSQSHSHSFATSGSMPLYGETATFETAQTISGGLMYDFGGAVRVLPYLAVGASISTVSDTETATISASVPSPIFFGKPVTVNGEQSGLNHKEIGFHIQAKIIIPTGAMLPQGSWLAVVVGPSFFSLSQDLIPSITVPSGTQTVVAAVEEQTGSGVGVNAGFEGRFRVAKFLGIGAFVRYAGATVDLDALKELKVGGFQAGVGVSVGFSVR